MMMDAVPATRLLDLKKPVASSPIRSGSTCTSSLQGDGHVPYLPDVIRTRMNQLLELAHSQ